MTKWFSKKSDDKSKPVVSDSDAFWEWGDYAPKKDVIKKDVIKKKAVPLRPKPRTTTCYK